MNHQPFEEWLLNEKPLEQKQKLELEIHLRDCRYCSALVETNKALHSVKMASPAAGFTARFQARLAQQRAAERRRRAWGSVLFTVGGAALLVWLVGPYVSPFFASPATWITALIEWAVFLFTTLHAITQAGSVFLKVVPGFLPLFVWMVLISAIAGVALLWFVSIWRFAQRGVSQGV
ncbi:MAG TPA: hypothetical protein VK900_13045 [Anaerolineales bacterium]|nr:hypothetical protein [Anaerolineales bacterium]